MVFVIIAIVAISPDRIAQSVACLTQEPEEPGSILGPATHFRFHFRRFEKGRCQLLANYGHLVLINRLGGLSLYLDSMVRLTDHSEMTIAVYRGS